MLPSPILFGFGVHFFPQLTLAGTALIGKTCEEVFSQHEPKNDALAIRSSQNLIGPYGGGRRVYSKAEADAYRLKHLTGSFGYHMGSAFTKVAAKYTIENQALILSNRKNLKMVWVVD